MAHGRTLESEPILGRLTSKLALSSPLLARGAFGHFIHALRRTWLRVCGHGCQRQAVPLKPRDGIYLPPQNEEQKGPVLFDGLSSKSSNLASAWVV